MHEICKIFCLKTREMCHWYSQTILENCSRHFGRTPTDLFLGTLARLQEPPKAGEIKPAWAHLSHSVLLTSAKQGQNEGSGALTPITTTHECSVILFPLELFPSINSDVIRTQCVTIKKNYPNIYT